MKNVKVLVVGAGPAGCSTAYHIKQFDNDNRINVELTDRLNKKKYRVYHDMCGEGVSREIINDLKPLRLNGVVSKINLIKEFYPEGIEIKIKMDGLLLDRPECFESIKNEFIKIGGNYREKTLKDFLQLKEKVKVKFDNEYGIYDFVVAADGANSLFRRKIGIKGFSKPFVQYIIDKEPEYNTIKFYYDEKFEGDYMWEFPHDRKTKIGFPKNKFNVENLKKKIISKQSRYIGYGGVNKYYSGRILLVGDAACQANPLTKGGIRPAVIAGKIAAKAIVNNNPNQYEIDWLKTQFSSEIYMKIFEKIKIMNNTELVKHMKPFKNANLENIFSRSFLHLKLLFFYNKYLEIYKAYDLSNKYGW